MTPAVNLIIRDAHPADHPQVVEVLAAAFTDGPIARWLDPNPASRPEHSHAYFTAVVAQTGAYGSIRVAQEYEGIVAAALWLPHPLAVAEPAQTTAPQHHEAGVPDGDVARRMHTLELLLESRHPPEAHHHLAFLGVRPDRQNLGIGSYLLTQHHGHLDAIGIPAYLEANDPRNHALYLRHGYTDVGSPLVVTLTGNPVWPMWRNPRLGRP